MSDRSPRKRYRLRRSIWGAEVARLKERLQVARDLVGVLRQSLAREKAARAVLAARLIDRQAEEMEEQRVAMLSDLHMDQIRLGTDIKREHESIRSLVAALYRSIAGQGGVPNDLAVSAEIPVQPPAPVEPDLTEGGFTLVSKPDWHGFLEGKLAGRTIKPPDGAVIVPARQPITTEMIVAAEQRGLLFDLILTMELPPE